MKIVNSCKAAGLPTPIMEEDGGGFIVKLFKDRFSEEELQKMGLNERQVKAVLHVKEKGKITNGEYMEINADITDRTALRDLDFLIETNVFQRVGEKKAAHYELVNVG
jgi:ATP-dependent DNA helicase RecG